MDAISPVRYKSLYHVEHGKQLHANSMSQMQLYSVFKAKKPHPISFPGLSPWTSLVKVNLRSYQ